MSKKLQKEDNQLNPSYVYQEDILAGYTDVTNNSIDWSLARNILDYNRRRNKIATLLTIKGNSAYPTINWNNWNSLSSDEKTLAAIMAICPYSLRNTIFSDTEDSINFNYVLTQTKEGRIAIIEEMRLCMASYMRLSIITLANLQDVYESINNEINYFRDSNNSKLKQWITNEIGSIYFLTGFASKPYYNSDIKDAIMLIYNGN